MIDINEKYCPLFNSDNRYCFMSGARGSGKSFVVTLYLVNRLLEGDNILFTRNTMTQAHISIIPVFVEMIELLGLSSEFTIKNKEIVCKRNGSIIYFRGLRTSSSNETANLKSLNVNIFVCEEAMDIESYDVYNTINLSVRDKKKKNKVILLFNPGNPDHWIFNSFYKNGQIKDADYIHTTFYDNWDNLSDSFIQQALSLKETDREMFEHLFLGEWFVNKNTLIYKNFRCGSLEEFSDDNLDQFETLFTADFGWVDKTALTKIHLDRDNKRIYVKELIYESYLTNDMLVDRIQNLVEVGSVSDYTRNNKITTNYQRNTRVIKDGDLIVCDSASPMVINYLRVEGKMNAVPVKKPKVLDRLRFIQGFEVIYHPDSHNFKNEISDYRFNENTEIISNKSHKNDHLLDSFSYGICFFYRL